MTTTITGSVGGIICDQQTWQDVTASRSVGTTYTNSTTRPIMVMVTVTTSAAAAAISLSLNGATAYEIFRNPANTTASGTTTFIVAVGGTYNISGSNNISKWMELR